MSDCANLLFGILPKPGLRIIDIRIQRRIDIEKNRAKNFLPRLILLQLQHQILSSIMSAKKHLLA